MTYFYSHIIEIETLLIKLDELELEPHHKKHLAHLIDSTIHNTILDLIMDHLSEKDKSSFLLALHKDPKDEKLIEFLNSKIDNIEDKIRQAAKKLKKEFHDDIEETKRLHGKK